MVVITGKTKGSGTKKTTTPKKKTEKVETPKKMCIACPSDKNMHIFTKFYRSYSNLHADGYIPMCKDCIQKFGFDDKAQDINIEGFKSILRQIDKPYIESILQSSINQYNEQYGGKNCPKNNRTKIIAYYFKNINSLRQLSTLDWNGGIEYTNRMGGSETGNVNTRIEDKYSLPQNNDEVYYLPDDGFQVTPDIIRLFGEGYKKNEYKMYWDKYNFLIKNYPNTTNLHTESIVTYIKFKVKEEVATSKGNVADAEKWSKMAIAAAEKAKINPSQLTQSDLQGGMNSFSELFKAVEQAVDVIPILPQFKFRPNDALDFNIFCYINYIRDLEGKPLCSYEDVYKFYDRRVSEYIEQYGDPYGIFQDDPTKLNRDKIKKFITLPKDYSDGDE